MPEPIPPDNKTRLSPPRAPAPETLKAETTGGLPTKPPASPSAPLSRLGRFEIRQVLGEGAFGRVYLAFDPELERSVAVKVPRRAIPPPLLAARTAAPTEPFSLDDDPPVRSRGWLWAGAALVAVAGAVAGVAAVAYALIDRKPEGIAEKPSDPPASVPATNPAPQRPAATNPAPNTPATDPPPVGPVPEVKKPVPPVVAELVGLWEQTPASPKGGTPRREFDRSGGVVYTRSGDTSIVASGTYSRNGSTIVMEVRYSFSKIPVTETWTVRALTADALEVQVDPKSTETYRRVDPAPLK